MWTPQCRDTCAEALGHGGIGATQPGRPAAGRALEEPVAAFTRLRALGLALEMGAEEGSSVTRVWQHRLPL